MDRKEMARFWRRAMMPDRELTPTEVEFVTAALKAPTADFDPKAANSRWDGGSDVQRMAELVKRDPSLLHTVGEALAGMAVAMEGCAPALGYLLNQGVVFSVERWRSQPGKAGEYDNVHEAAWACCTDNLRLLFDHDMVDPNTVSNPHTGWPNNVSLLYWAVFNGINPNRDAGALVQLLLQHGTDPEIRFTGNGERGNTALQEAAVLDKPGKEELVRMLLAGGACYDVFTACSLNDLQRVQELARERPAIARASGEIEVTPLHWAARTGAAKTARWLLRHGADIDAATTAGRTPLHLAVDRNQVDMVFLLTGQGADLNAADIKGRTPLHRATYNGCVEAAEALIVLGANPRHPNQSGKTPLQVARLGCKYLKES
jgi:hypothetical protein